MRRKVIRGLLVGCGRAGAATLAQFCRHPNSQPVGIVDPNPEAVAKLDLAKTIPVFADLDCALRSVTADVAIIASPNRHHAEQFLACAQRGLHVWCEKPVALRLEDAEEMRAAAARARIKVATPYQIHSAFFLEEADARFHSGQLGRLVQIFCNKMGSAGFTSDGRGGHYAVRDPELSGGWILHCFCHIVDWAIQIGGPVASVFCATDTTVPNPRSHQEEAVTAILRFQNGGTATLLENQSWHKYHRYGIIGDAGGIFLDRFPRAVAPKEPCLIVEIIEGQTVHREALDAPTYETRAQRHPSLMKRFFDAIEQDLPSPVPMERSVEVLRVCLALRESAETGEVVSLTEKRQTPKQRNRSGCQVHGSTVQGLEEETFDPPAAACLRATHRQARAGNR